MYFSWSDDTIRWFLAASDFTGFHRALAGRLRPRLTPGGTLADLGCGAGLIDLELAGYAGHITCVDRAGEPLAWIEREAARRGITNLDTRQADARALSGQWDDVMMTFYGAGAELVDTFLPLCRRSVTAVIRAGGESAFGPPQWRERHRELLEETVAALDGMGARYTLERGELEYGQPLRSRAEGMEFVRASCKAGVPDSEVETYLDAHLEERPHPNFPFYLPNQKRFGILTLLREENRHLITAERGL